jgi:glycolate oxidase iron-sulfur subunit
MDSPRGRINLMAQRLEGEPLSPSMVKHFDQCLGCMACVTACPSGVKYDELITRTRADIPARGLLFHLFPYPRRLRLLRWPIRAYQAVTRGRRLFARWPKLGTLESLMPKLAKPAPAAQVHGARRATVGMLTGCVQSAFFPHVNAATERVLAAEGCEVLPFPKQGCCGALSVHNGRTAEAQRFARKLIDAVDLERIEYFVVNAAGCGSALKEYGALLAEDPAYAAKARALAGKVRDLSEVLVELGPVAPRKPRPETVVYHDACHLAHAQGVRTQPRVLLNRIPGLDVREIAEAEICCGSAGVWNIQHPEPARELGERKARAILATGATTVVTSNPGCIMQITAALDRLGATVSVVHTAELLDSTISARE